MSELGAVGGIQLSLPPADFHHLIVLCKISVKCGDPVCLKVERQGMKV